MRKITLICVGNLKEKFFRDAFLEYEKRLSKFFDFKIVEIAESKLVKAGEAEIKKVVEQEGEKILKKIEGKRIICLAIEGEVVDSVKFSEIVARESDLGEVCFVIGGSYGIYEKIKNMGKNVSFGRITLPHQLCRIVFMEQLYRAGTIINNIEYHK